MAGRLADLRGLAVAPAPSRPVALAIVIKQSHGKKDGLNRLYVERRKKFDDAVCRSEAQAELGQSRRATAGGGGAKVLHNEGGALVKISPKIRSDSLRSGRP